MNINSLVSKPLKIGIDFDNTIVLYDHLFHKLAYEKNLITAEIPKNKKIIRDHIRLLPNGEERWIVLQATIYGLRMSEAIIAEGFEAFFDWAIKHKHQVYIISHKTQYPSLGPQTDLHLVALAWMEDQGFFNKDEFALSRENVFFEPTLFNKLKCIAKRDCTHFIDDLEEVLTHRDFPNTVDPIHFTKFSTEESTIMNYSNWHDILAMFKKL